MARKPVASLKSTLLARNGDASPPPVAMPSPASEEMVKLTVKLTPEEHLRPLQLDLRSRSLRSNQGMIREAVLRDEDEAEAEDPGPTDQGWNDRRPIEDGYAPHERRTG